MPRFKNLVSVLLVAFVVVQSMDSTAQSLAANGSVFRENTVYPVFPVNDPIFYFCATEGSAVASLTASSAGSLVNFTWEKFDPVSVKFLPLTSETGTTSTRSQLTDGCYRVSFTESGTSRQYRAWVFNSWIRPAASIAESTCTTLKLAGSVAGPAYQYWDLSNGKTVPLGSGYTYRWIADNKLVSQAQNPFIQSPPSKNTTYRIEVTDRSGCMKSAEVSYLSPIPVAKFSWTTPQKNDPQFVFPQAPADIDFKNESENSDADKYEWYLFKDTKALDALGKGAAPEDSFLTVMYDTNPLYTYEMSGRYKVKLIAGKTVQSLTCRDTFYLPDFIVVDTSLVRVAPAFTPNGDGINDMLVIKTRSLESLDFTVLNRWGKVVHHYSAGYFLPADAEIAAWDGKVNGNYCPSGVYFYVVDAKGRDGVRRKTKGFVELIR